MRKVLFLLLVLTAAPALAQTPEQTTVSKEHEWLKKFVGEWEVESVDRQEGADENQTISGSISAKMLGEFWIVNRHKVDAPGFAFSAMQTIGYDATKKKFVGNWVDTVMNHMWVYNGRLSKDGNKLILMAKGPKAANDVVLNYRDSYEFKSKDLIHAKSEMQDEDGNWTVFMTSSIKRKE
ncbi:MAG: DUF1579 domain-containing protein [Planctomycetota bacterium]